MSHELDRSLHAAFGKLVGVHVGEKAGARVTHQRSGGDISLTFNGGIGAGERLDRLAEQLKDGGLTAVKLDSTRLILTLPRDEASVEKLQSITLGAATRHAAAILRSAEQDAREALERAVGKVTAQQVLGDTLGAMADRVQEKNTVAQGDAVQRYVRRSQAGALRGC